MIRTMFFGLALFGSACSGTVETDTPFDTEPEVETDSDLPAYSVQLAGAWYLPLRSNVTLAHTYSGDMCYDPFLSKPWLFRFRWMDNGEPLTCEIKSSPAQTCRIQVEFPDEQAGILRVVAEIPVVGCAGAESGRLYQGEALIELPYQRVAEADPDRDVIQVMDARYELEMLNETVLLFSQQGRPETRASLARGNTFVSLPP